MPKREIIKPSGMPVPGPTFSPGVRFGRWVFASGQIAADYVHGLAPEAQANPHVPLAGEDQVVRESRVIFKSLETVLEAAGTNLANAVRIDQFPTFRGAIDPYHVVRRDYITPPRPASTSVGVTGLMVPETSIEVELVAIVPEPGFQKEGIGTDEIPQPIGGYMPAIKAGDFVFVAGQLPTDWKTGIAPEARVDPIFWEGNEIDRQTRYVLKNLALTLEAAGSSLQNVAKAQVYLTDINDLPRFDMVWREAFPESPPARTILPTSALGVLGSRVEINLVALVDSGQTKKEVISTNQAPAPLFHESQAVRAGDLLFLSGLLAADEGGLVQAARIDPHYPYGKSSPEEQMRAIMQNATAISQAAGADIRNGLRLQTFHTDLHEYLPAARVRREAFPDGQPATTTVQIPGPLQVPGCTILVDLWVGIP